MTTASSLLDTLQSQACQTTKRSMIKATAIFAIGTIVCTSESISWRAIHPKRYNVTLNPKPGTFKDPGPL